MKTIEINDVKFIVPTSYNELEGKALEMVCKRHIENSALNQFNALFYLLGLKWWRITDLKRWRVVYKLPSEWIHTLLVDKSLFGWIDSPSKLTEYKLSKFRIGWRQFYGPRKNILNLNAVELTQCYELFRLYASDQKKNIKYLDMLIAIIYREKNWFWWFNRYKYGFDGDVRVPLSEYGFNKRTKLFSKLPGWKKVLIFLQFAGKWDEFENLERNKLIFPKFDQVNSNKKHDPDAWRKIMMKMAESGAFGPLSEVEKTDKDRFFLNMVRAVEEYLAIKDKMNSKK